MVTTTSKFSLPSGKSSSVMYSGMLCRDGLLPAVETPLYAPSRRPNTALLKLPLGRAVRPVLPPLDAVKSAGSASLSEVAVVGRTAQRMVMGVPLCGPPPRNSMRKLVMPPSGTSAALACGTNRTVSASSLAMVKVVLRPPVGSATLSMAAYAPPAAGRPVTPVRVMVMVSSPSLYWSPRMVTDRL